MSSAQDGGRIEQVFSERPTGVAHADAINVRIPIEDARAAAWFVAERLIQFKTIRVCADAPNSEHKSTSRVF